jgi:hypothetical protein
MNQQKQSKFKQLNYQRFARCLALFALSWPCAPLWQAETGQNFLRASRGVLFLPAFLPAAG